MNAYDQKMQMPKKQSLTKVSGLPRNATFSMCMIWKVCGSRTSTQDYGYRAVKSSTPAMSRENQTSPQIIMSGDEKALNAFIQEFRGVYELTEDIAYPRSCNATEKYSAESKRTMDLMSGENVEVLQERFHTHQGSDTYEPPCRKAQSIWQVSHIAEGDKIKFIAQRA